MVSETGLEPVCPLKNGHKHLKLACLPIPPLRRGFYSEIILAEPKRMRRANLEKIIN